MTTFQALAAGMAALLGWVVTMYIVVDSIRERAVFGLFYAAGCGVVAFVLTGLALGFR